jgi:Spy/CpxP family protein refolding chaperone
MKKIYILFICLFSGISILKAQDDKPEKNARIESYKIAFITERLNLTPKEATAFWPVYNEFSDQLKKIKRSEKERIRYFKEKTQVTDAESERFLSEFLSSKQQEFDLTKKYVVEFKRVLPPDKVARLVTLEQEFKMELLNRLKDKRGNQR